MGFRGQAAYRARDVKVSKFPTALDRNSGRFITFKEIRTEFFNAAKSESPKQAVATLREKFKLACPHCQKADLVFSFGSQTPDGRIKAIAGSNLPGNPAHLKTKARETHKPHCIGVVIESEGHEIDTDKGYRINLNLKTIPERHPLSKQLVRREPGGKIITLDPDLKGREPWDLSKPQRIIPLMKSGQTDRLEKSVIVHGSHKIKWQEFMIPATEKSGDQNENLAAYVRSCFKHGVGHAAMFDLAFGKSTSSNNSDPKLGIEKHYKFPRSAPIFVEGVGNIIVIPEVRVKNEHLFKTTDDLQRHQKESFLIAEKPYIYKRDSKTNVYMLVIPLADPDMMVEASLKDIMAISRQREARAKTPANDLLTAPQP